MSVCDMKGKELAEHTIHLLWRLFDCSAPCCLLLLLLLLQARHVKSQTGKSTSHTANPRSSGIRRLLRLLLEAVTLPVAAVVLSSQAVLLMLQLQWGPAASPTAGHELTHRWEQLMWR
jgi:hypothetical protein